METSSDRSDRHFENQGIVSFNQPVGHELHEGGQKALDLFRALDEFDSQRHMVGGIESALSRVYAVVGAEACLGTHPGCARNTFPQQ
jgi:hypothetical protein